MPGRFILGAHPDGLIALLECIRSADHLLVECLIKAPFDPGDIREDVLARLGLLDRNDPGAGRGVRNSLIGCQGDARGSQHGEEFPPGHSSV